MNNTIAGTDVPSNASRSGDIKQFAIKTCIVAGVISICAIIVVEWTVSTVEDFAARTTDDLRAAFSTKIARGGGPQFWSSVERELDRAADPASDLPPETKRKLLHDVGVIVARWRPFIDAVRDELQKSSPAAN